MSSSSEARWPNSWRRGRWDSLRLLTPNWLSRLPAYRYEGGDPDGFMTMPEVIGYLTTYAGRIAAPVDATARDVLSVRTGGDGDVVVTTTGEWTCRSVVLASGPYNRPGAAAPGSRPAGTTHALSAAAEYRRPDQLDKGGVLVVGAGRHGHPAGRRDSALRTPGDAGRGRARAAAARLPGHGHHVVARREPGSSMNAMTRSTTSCGPATWRRFSSWARPTRTTVDLNSLQRLGVRLVGRLAGVTSAEDGPVLGLPAEPVRPRRSQARSVARHPGRVGHQVRVDSEAEPPERFPPTDVPPALRCCFLDQVRSRPWCGRPATAPIIRGYMCRSSTTRGRCATTGE